MLEPAQPVPPEQTREALEYLRTRYDIYPDWCTVVYSNTRLPLWQAAATWILDEDQTRTPLVQLRNRLKERQRLFLTYSKHEILAHELIHAVRCAFDEPAFEEVLAYSSSPRKSSMWLAPLAEGKTALKTVGSGILNTACCIPYTGWSLLSLSWIFMATCVAAGGWTAWSRVTPLQRCVRMLKSPTLAGEHAEAMALRLTDAEIQQFAQSTEAQVNEYAGQQPCLRWQVIREAYLAG